MSKNIVPHILLAISAATVVFIGWYLLILLNRTELLMRGTSIAWPHIVGFHVLSITAICVSALLQRKQELKYGRIICIAAIIIETSFFLMNWSGYVWQYQKGAPDSLYAALAELINKILK